MLAIRKEADTFIFDVLGLHKLWAFKSQLSIPAAHIANAYQDMERVKGWAGWRLPGTYVPWIIRAGTFYKDGNKTFWDVSDIKNAIIVELQDEIYAWLIIEVDNPTAAINLLTSKK